MIFRPLTALALVLAATASTAEDIQTQAGEMTIEAVVEDLVTPWSFGFLPEGGLLITERDGELLYVGPDGESHVVSGTPTVVANGQGGLLDLLIPKDFAQTREIFLTFAKPQGRGEGTAVARATLSADARRLSDLRVIFEMEWGSNGGRHFGSRIVEGPDGHLYFTIGDRGDRPSAQDLSRHNGSVIRIARDGSVPDDNPFVGRDGAQPEIWSYGHRNPQGAAVDGQGRIWVNEHGARGGDEVNLIRKGANYGWPVIAYGRHYSGRTIGEGTEKPGMEQPEHYWDPSIAPSGMVFHSGTGVSDWRGDAFVGSLKFDYIARLDGSPLREVEQIRAEATARVRDVREGPDGALWFLSIGNGTLFRMSPKD